MHVERQTLVITSTAGGAAEVYSGVVNGIIRSIRYVKTDYAAGDVAATLEATGRGLWTETGGLTATKEVRPGIATHDVAGVAALYAGGGSAVLAPVYAAGERVKIVLASAGAAKVGTWHLIVEGTIDGSPVAVSGSVA